MVEEQGTFVKEEEKEFKRFYRLSKWYIGNRELLKKIGYGVFIAFDAVLLLFVLWTMLDSFVISYGKEHRSVAEMVAIGQTDLHSYTVATSADPLVTENVSVISLGENKYDFYTTVTNPNGDWWADFTYVFTSSEGDIVEATEFILPGEEKPVVAFAQEADSAPKNAEITITDVSWHRIDHHLVGDYEVWSQDRMNFEFENVAWTTNIDLEDNIGRVTFNVKNDTAFSYYDPVFYSLLMRGNRVVGVNRTTISSLDSFESAEVVINWFGTLPSVSKVEIVPVVNIFDFDVYKPLEGETTTDTRTRVFRRRR